MRYDGAFGSYGSNWSVRVDVNFAAPSTIFTGGVEQFINLGLMVTRTGVVPGVAEGAPTFDAFLVESNLYQSDSGWKRDIRTAVFAPGSVENSNRYPVSQLDVPGATSAAVQISYNAATHILSAGYDIDGATGGYSFSAMTDLTADTSTWGMTGSDTFSIFLMGSSGYDGEESGVGPEISVGMATLDNLSLTAVPEPSTYAAILGAAALGLAAWRRRQMAA